MMHVESVEGAEDIRLDDFPAVLIEVTSKTVWSRRFFTWQVLYCLLNLILCEGPVEFKARQLLQGF